MRRKLKKSVALLLSAIMLCISVVNQGTYAYADETEVSEAEISEDTEGIVTESSEDSQEEEKTKEPSERLNEENTEENTEVPPAAEETYISEHYSRMSVMNLEATQETEEEYTPGSSAEKDGDKTVVSEESGIDFGLYNYSTEINYEENGDRRDLANFFSFRAGVYNDSFTNKDYDEDGFTVNHATVKRVLNSHGYPEIDLEYNTKGDARAATEYLKPSDSSIGYLFGEGSDHAVTSYAPTNTILQKNDNHYYYNSADNAVDFDIDNNIFRVRNYNERNSSTVTYEYAGASYDFLPFNYTDGEFIDEEETYNIDTKNVDYWFGLDMGFKFFQTEDGRMKKADGSKEDNIFYFSGDDDVWVFVDGVRVLDLGGTHGTVTGSINFATGEIKQHIDWNGQDENTAGKSFPTTIRECFEKAGRVDSVEWNGAGTAFADYTEHTLKFYYMERGSSVANCMIDFNLIPIPDNTVSVTKQVEGLNDVLTSDQTYKLRLMVKDKEGNVGPCTETLDGAGTEVIFDADGWFSLKDKETAYFLIKADCESYYIEEDNAEDYEVSFKHIAEEKESAAAVEGTKAKSAVYSMELADSNEKREVTVINKAKDYKLTVKKNFILRDKEMDHVPSEFDAVFTLYDAKDFNREKPLEMVRFSDFSADQTYTFEDLLPGTYVVVETDPTFNEEAENFMALHPDGTISNSGEITAENQHAEVSITNDYDYETRSLTVDKKIVGSEKDKNKEYSFTLTFKDNEGKEYVGDFTYIKKTARGNEEGTVVSGETFTLKHGESIVFTIPCNCQYEVEEKDYTSQGYTTIYTHRKETDTGEYKEVIKEKVGVKVTDTLSENQEISYINQAPVSLRITKRVGGNAGSTNYKFKFTLELEKSGKDIDYVACYEEGARVTKIETGVYEIELAHRDSAIFRVPYGTKYKVVEEDYSGKGYVTSIGREDSEETREAKGTLKEEETIVYYINVRETENVLPWMVPGTGDGADFVLWIAVLVVAVGSIVYIGKKCKRQ